ncbi:pyridoxal phosphate-dependent decarboxylase family protein [Nocardioides litoris]|uniref:pyridoxal phosphate-dependent decarboxylase family protein n=1 Tax=Nocardioides litoris TaxID=1926648 RepID=UPI001FE5198D|nr:aminotransferase class V-fold PLP-dependent enzyme [Nocardioides litoris]
MAAPPAQSPGVDQVHPLSHLFHPRHAAMYAATMRRGVDHLTAALARAEGRASTGVAPAQAAKPVADVDLDAPLLDVDAALEEVTRLYLDDAVWFHEPTYAAHLNCPVVIPALLAEVFVSGVNSSLDTFDQSVGGTFIERRLVEWTAGRLGFGPGADGVFTSGGTQSNLQALLLARDHALASGADATRLRVVASADGHFSVQKAVRLLGLGDDAVVTVPVDHRRRMDVVALAATLARLAAAGDHVAAVVATAGTTDFGAVDPLPEVGALARAHGAWFHVDAAYGGGLLASTTRRHWLAGIEAADSVTIDYHKTWFQPVSSSALVVADARHLGHVTWHADYLNPRGGVHVSANQVDKSIQTTRRFDALKLWMTLRVMGADRVGEYVDTVVDLAAEVGRRLAARDDVELAADPQLSTVVWRYRPAGLSVAEADRLVPLVRAALHARGQGMVASTKVDGHAWLKLTLLNPMATADDVVGVVDALVAIATELLDDEEDVA